MWIGLLIGALVSLVFICVKALKNKNKKSTKETERKGMAFVDSEYRNRLIAEQCCIVSNRKIGRDNDVRA